MHKDINVTVGGPVNADYPKVYKTKFLKPGISFGLQVTDTDTKYVIKYNFDLGGESVTILSGCLIEFDGGLLSNGTIVGQNTIMIYHQEIDDILKNIILSGTFTIASSIDTLPPQEGKSGKFLTTDGEDAYWEDIPEQVTVDQTYNATSQNPQSGVAVAEGLENKQDVIEDLANIRSGASAGATAYHKPIGGIPSSDLTSSVQASLNKADTAYQKANTGIPNTDMSDDVQASLEKANTAIQEHQDISGKADKSTTLAGYGITDAYTKTETYNKTEVNELVSTPHQNYVTVATKEELDDIVEGGTASDDTIYRVSSYDFTANGGTGDVDVTKYSEYAYNGSVMVPLTVKSQVNEVFDISEYHSGAKYVNLEAALGVGGENVPTSVKRGGMTVKFICSSFYDRYVEFRFLLSSFTDGQFVNTNNWQGIDNSLDVISNNLVSGRGIIEGTTTNHAHDVLCNTNDILHYKGKEAATLETSHFSSLDKVIVKVKNLSTVPGYFTVKYSKNNDATQTELFTQLVNPGDEYTSQEYTIYIGPLFKFYTVNVNDVGMYEVHIINTKYYLHSLFNRIKQNTERIDSIGNISGELPVKTITIPATDTTKWASLNALLGKKVLLRCSDNLKRQLYINGTAERNAVYNTWHYYDFTSAVTGIQIYYPPIDHDVTVYYIDCDAIVQLFINDKIINVTTAAHKVTGGFFITNDHKKLGYQAFDDTSIEIYPNKNSNAVSVLSIDDTYTISVEGVLYRYSADNGGYLKYADSADIDNITVNSDITVVSDSSTSQTIDVDIPAGAYALKGTFSNICWVTIQCKDEDGNMLAGDKLGNDDNEKSTVPNQLYRVGDVLEKRLYFNKACKTITLSNPNGAIISLEFKRIEDSKEYDIVVAADGSGQLTSLYDAIRWVGDTSLVHKTIFVKPGNYEMPKLNFNTNVYRQKRNISIIGADKNSVVIYTEDGFYTPAVADSAPLQLAGNVTIKNVTINSLSTHPSAETNISAYCIHVDYPVYANSLMLIENCVLYNDHGMCIGIGLRPDFTLKIKNCEMKTILARHDAWSGAVVCHSGGSGTGQKLIFDSNIIESAGQGFSIVGNDDPVTVEFIKNAVFTGNGYDVIHTDGAAGVVISDKSCLNNKSELNS